MEGRLRAFADVWQGEDVHCTIARGYWSSRSFLLRSLCFQMFMNLQERFRLLLQALDHQHLQGVIIPVPEHKRFLGFHSDFFTVPQACALNIWPEVSQQFFSRCRSFQWSWCALVWPFSNQESSWHRWTWRMHTCTFQFIFYFFSSSSSELFFEVCNRRLAFSVCGFTIWSVHAPLLCAKVVLCVRGVPVLLG